MQPPTHTRAADDENSNSVDIFDGDRLLGPATVTGSHWVFRNEVPLAVGNHTFTARAGNKISSPWTVKIEENDAGLAFSRPHVQEATIIEGDKERLNYYEVGDDIHIIVQDDNLRAGDTVKLYWFGTSVTLGSDIRSVTDPKQPMSFVISRYEVIDVIGGNASSHYTVRRLPDTTDHPSASVSLIVDGHTYDVLAPTIDGAHEVLKVARQSQFNQRTTAAIRCIGGDGDSDIWSSDHKTFEANTALTFTIDNTWLQRNLNKSVKFNASIRVNPTDKYLFSRLLRIKSL